MGRIIESPPRWRAHRIGAPEGAVPVFDGEARGGRPRTTTCGPGSERALHKKPRRAIEDRHLLARFSQTRWAANELITEPVTKPKDAGSMNTSSLSSPLLLLTAQFGIRVDDLSHRDVRIRRMLQVLETPWILFVGNVDLHRITRLLMSVPPVLHVAPCMQRLLQQPGSPRRGVQRSQRRGLPDPGTNRVMLPGRAN